MTQSLGRIRTRSSQAIWSNGNHQGGAVRTRFARAAVLGALMCVASAETALSQESAAEFNRREWARQSGSPTAFGGPRSSIPVARRPVEPARSASPRDFFSALFGVRSDYGSQDEGSRPYLLITPRGGSGEGGTGNGLRSGSGNYAFCVRTCDGRYFPLQGRPDSAGDPNAAAQCAAFCPASKMEVFVSADREQGIEGAYNKSGKAYTEIPNAFVFRQRIVADCSCRRNDQVGGMGRIDVKDDPTLKKGDIVMTNDGARIFSGKRSRPPFRESDFVEAERFPGLPSSLKQRIAELTPQQ